MVEGSCDPRFERIREEFERNFAERGELGASVCVVIDGEPVVDLWGGVKDPSTGEPWERDTINVIMSCSKGVAALCGNLILDRGLLDVDAPVAQYWPEFAAKGKENVTVRHAYSHQSGVCHVSDPVPSGGMYDWKTFIGLIEQTTPFWEPGTRSGYHGTTVGQLIGELLRRVDGRTIGTFLREELVEPLGIDLHMGLPEEHEGRVAPSIPFDPTAPGVPPDLLAAATQLDGLILQILTNNGDWIPTWDTREAHAAELPSTGVITNGRGLAGVYTPFALDGEFNGNRFLKPESMAGLRYAQASSDRDAVLGSHASYTLGLSKSWNGPTHPSGLGGNGMIIGEDAFGTPGLGGQVGFADPFHRLAFGYTMNKHGTGTGLNVRGESLVDAVYQILGSPTRAPGFWVRP